MRSELASPNPNTAIFRDFAASRVALGPNAQKRWQELGGDGAELRAAGESRGTPVPPPPPPVSWNDGSDRSRAAAHATAQAPRTTTATRTAPSSSAASATNGNGESCRYCSAALPEGRSAKFCPHCGQNLTIQRCPACGTELEIDWKFCITCGRGVATS
jgi:hypothetical protein